MPPSAADQRIGSPEQTLDMGPQIVGRAEPFIAHGCVTMNDAGDFAVAGPGLPAIPCLQCQGPTPCPPFGWEQRSRKAAQAAHGHQTAQHQNIGFDLGVARHMKIEMDGASEQCARSHRDTDTARPIGDQHMLTVDGMAQDDDGMVKCVEIKQIDLARQSGARIDGQRRGLSFGTPKYMPGKIVQAAERRKRQDAIADEIAAADGQDAEWRPRAQQGP